LSEILSRLPFSVTCFLRPPFDASCLPATVVRRFAVAKYMRNFVGGRWLCFRLTFSTRPQAAIIITRAATARGRRSAQSQQHQRQEDYGRQQRGQEKSKRRPFKQLNHGDKIHHNTRHHCLSEASWQLLCR
jgi:hypothetical protein